MFSKFSESFIMELSQESSYQFYVASFSELGILCFFPQSCYGKNLYQVKTLYQKILLRKW